MRKTIFAVAISAMLFVGASVAMAQTDTTTPVGRVGGFITEVLDGLVSDGTIDQSQADAVREAFEEKRASIHADREAVREAMQEAWEDGVLTEDELSALPNGGSHLTDPDGPLAEYWSDGELTKDELAAARAAGDLGFGRGRHGGPGPGPGSGSGSGSTPQDSSLGA